MARGRLKFALSRIFHVGFFYLRMVDGCSSAIPRVGCTSGIQPLATSDLKLHLLITLALQRFRAMVPRLRLPQPASQHRFSTCVRSGDSFSLRLTSAGQWRGNFSPRVPLFRLQTPTQPYESFTLITGSSDSGFM